MSAYRKSLLLGVAFCLLVSGLIGYYLHNSYQQEKRLVEERVSRTSHLIAEWVKGAFLASDYVLRDIIGQVPLSELRYPHEDPARHARDTNLLIDKVKTLPFATGVALADKNCIITHVWNMPPRPSIVGFDGRHRAWCKLPSTNLELEAFVTNSGMSLTRKLVVWQMRQYPGRATELNGMAGITVELDFFSQWLEQIAVDPHGMVAILDMNLSLLARKPVLPDALGKRVNDADTAVFIGSGEPYGSFTARSPLDGESRLYGARKVEGLPFVVVVGEADSDWLTGWWQRFWLVLFSLGILFSLVLLNVRDYWKVLRQSELLAEAANTDPLTNLVSRRYFTELAAREIRRARRLDKPLGLMLLDIDHFKTINDTHGHAIGDMALVAFAETCRNTLRDIDIIARLGGDEFVVLLPETDGHGAACLAERVRQAIGAMRFENNNGERINLTTSIGFSSAMGQAAPELKELIKQADAGLYRAKQAGRNAVGNEPT